MTDSELMTLMNSMTIQEPSLRDQEPNHDFHRIFKNTNIVRDFFNAPHTLTITKKFIETNVFVFKLYLRSRLFNQVYINVPKLFLEDINNYKIGIQFFLANYNEHNISYNIEFIKLINEKLQDFLYYHYYDTGYLI